MSAPAFTESMAAQILSAELYPTRLENVCIDLFTEVDGEDYMPTSASYDLGRDGRSRSGAFIACGTSDDPMKKALDDVDRILEHAKISHFHFCSIQKISEQEIERIKAEIRKKCPSADSIEIHGVKQLAILFRRHPFSFQTHYRGELENLHSVLLTTSDEEYSSDTMGMRLALTTQLNDDGAALKKSVLKNLILLSLSNGSTQNIPGLARRVSESLQLPHAINTAYFQPELSSLMGDGFIEPVGNAYKITAAGTEEIKKGTEEGTKQLFEARKLFHEALDTLADAKLSIEEFNRVWNVIQDGLAPLFLTHGLSIITAVGSVLSGDSDLSQHDDLADAIGAIGKSIENLQLRSTDLSRAMGQAFVDALHDKQSPLFEWLTKRCLIYVTACSLGLQPEAQRQVTSRIKELDLILDTDVVLSLLGDAEANHRAIIDLIKTWRRIGGNIYVTGPVLEEVAYHAWVSDRDMQSAWPHIIKYSDIDAIQLLPNVFVRGFRKYAPRMSLHGWRQYIANFRGSHDRDYSKIRALLKDEGVNVVTDEAVQEPLADLVATELYQRKSTGLPASEPRRLAHLQSKCSRDGRLVALLLAHRNQKQELGRSAVIVSSSGYLEAVCRKFARTNDAVDPVMSAGAVAYLLTLSPGVAMSMKSLQRLLFDPGFGEQMGPLDRRALHIIKSSNEYSLPFSRRHALRDEMHRSMARFAASRGETVEAIEERYENAENDEEFMQLVANSVDAFATSKSEEENRRLSSENEDLKRRIAMLERKAAKKQRGGSKGQ